MKKIFAIVTMLVSLLVAVSTGFTATASAAGQQYPSFVDGAALVQPVDKTKLLSKLREIESKHGIRCAVLTVKTTQGMNIRDYAQSVQDQYFANAPKGSILMVISMDNRKWHITTDKTMRIQFWRGSCGSHHFVPDWRRREEGYDSLHEQCNERCGSRTVPETRYLQPDRQ